MATLNGTTPAATYPSLIKFDNNSAISAALRLLSDGSGNATPLYLSQTQMNIGGTGLINATLGIKGSDIASGSYSLIAQNLDSTALLLFSNSGNFQISNVAGTSTLTGTTLLTSNVGVNITPTAKLHTKGTGTTSATTSFRAENSSNSSSLNFDDIGALQIISATSTICQINAAGANFYNIKSLGGFGLSQLNLQSVMDIYSNDGTLGIRVNDAYTAIADATAIGQTTAPAASAMVDIISTTKGALIPRMTTTQANAIASPAQGLIIYNTTINLICFYNGTSWLRIPTTTAM